MDDDDTDRRPGADSGPVRLPGRVAHPPGRAVSRGVLQPLLDAYTSISLAGPAPAARDVRLRLHPEPGLAGDGRSVGDRRAALEVQPGRAAGLRESTFMKRYGRRRFYHTRCCLLVGGLFILCGLASQTEPAFACGPTLTPPGFTGFSTTDYVNTSQVVVEGEIIAVTKYKAANTLLLNLGEDEAAVQVRQYFQGSGPTTIDIRGFGPATACFIEAHVGAGWIFFATSDTQGVLWIRHVESITPGNLAQVAVAAGQLPVPSSLSVSPAALSVLLSAAGLMMVSIVVAALFFARPRRSKQDRQ
jgi:hypothetical protein